MGNIMRSLRRRMRRLSRFIRNGFRRMSSCLDCLEPTNQPLIAEELRTIIRQEVRPTLKDVKGCVREVKGLGEEFKSIFQ